MRKSRMVKYVVAYAATLVVMLALDGLWIGVLAKSMYQEGIGHLMAAKPKRLCQRADGLRDSSERSGGRSDAHRDAGWLLRFRRLRDI